MGFVGGGIPVPTQAAWVVTPRHSLGVPAGAESGPGCSGEAGDGQGVSPGAHGQGATHSSCTAAGSCCVGQCPSPAGTRDTGSAVCGSGSAASPGHGAGWSRAGIAQRAGGAAVGSTGAPRDVPCHPEQGP